VGTVAANVLEHGTGALNIDGCRIATTDNLNGGGYSGERREAFGATSYAIKRGGLGPFVQPAGRWPANVVLDEDQAAELDQQSGVSKSPAPYVQRSEVVGIYGAEKHHDRASTHHGDSGGASRFFYVAKAPARERPKVDGTAHPTVKPLTLMRWLCRLVTPPDGVILEPFAGSGTTVEAALLEGFRVVAIEREADYLPLIQARLDRVAAQEPEDEQLTLDASA
jgi:site-specific DNA-methyltransferase (adenine-specific)